MGFLLESPHLSWRTDSFLSSVSRGWTKRKERVSFLSKFPFSSSFLDPIIVIIGLNGDGMVQLGVDPACWMTLLLKVWRHPWSHHTLIFFFQIELNWIEFRSELNWMTHLASWHLAKNVATPDIHILYIPVVSVLSLVVIILQHISNSILLFQICLQKMS